MKKFKPPTPTPSLTAMEEEGVIVLSLDERFNSMKRNISRQDADVNKLRDRVSAVEALARKNATDFNACFTRMINLEARLQACEEQNGLAIGMANKNAGMLSFCYAVCKKISENKPIASSATAGRPPQ